MKQEPEVLLVCRSCDTIVAMVTEMGFCARCYWLLERASLSQRIGEERTLRVDPRRARRD